MPYLEARKKKLINKTILNLRETVYTPVADLMVEVWISKEPLTFENRFNGDYRILKFGESWGQRFDCAWFKFSLEITPDIIAEFGEMPYALMIDVSGEGCIVDSNGNPLQGITCKFNEDFTRDCIGATRKRIYPLNRKLNENEKIEIWMDAGCNNYLGGYYNEGKLEKASLVSIDNLKRKLFYDMQVLNDLAGCLPESEPRHKRITDIVYRACCGLRNMSHTEIRNAIELLRPELEKKNGDADLEISAIGHAHIDLAWIWPIRETKRKGARTFSTALKLMEEYPWYVFGESQPQLYQWMKEDYPQLYERIKERVLEGRIEAQGAMWVEPDTNVTSGESLVRQLLYGMKFFEDEFGITPETLWLPDTFGYSGALPQLLKKSGIKYFMTQKMCWSEWNKFPHHTFWWEGIDGSRVLAHMLPENTYNGAMSPKSIHYSMNNYIDSDVSENFLMLYGIGDGGGGPGREHLERAQRMFNLAGLCPVHHEKSDAFFSRLEKNSEKYAIWRGEMYLEKHQGTYTTQGLNKYYNRKCEIALREAEFAASLNGGFTVEEKESVDRLWKEVLLYQFHDILPGSAIKRVYDECHKRYPVILREIEALTDKHYNAVAASAAGEVYFNSLSWSRTIWIESENGDKKRLTLPALGYACSCAAENVAAEVYADELSIENEKLRVEFDSEGAVIGVFDKTNKVEIINGKAALLKVYGETVADCWDIDATYIDSDYELFELIEQHSGIDGKSAFMKQKYRYDSCLIEMTVMLESLSEYVDFSIEVDWNPDSKMLRMDFPLTVSSPYSVSEIQFGKIRRSTGENTSWEAAQYETVAQKWVDLSRKDYGVALLNDCKYGYRVTSDCISINLLRSQDCPGEKSDRGHHSIRCALYPHIGDEAVGNVQKAAYEYNVPVKISKGNGSNTDPINYFTVSENVIADTVKPAEAGDGIVTRIFEPNGAKVNAEISVPYGCKQVFVTDLRENQLDELQIKNGMVSFDFKPFEVATFKFGF